MGKEEGGRRAEKRKQISCLKNSSLDFLFPRKKGKRKICHSVLRSPETTLLFSVSLFSLYQCPGRGQNTKCPPSPLEREEKDGFFEVPG